MSNLPDNLTAVVFSGGDAPGMNALLRSLVRLGSNRYHRDVLGVRDGYKGLVRAARRLASGEVSIVEMKEKILAQRGTLGLLDPTQDLILMTNQSVSGIVVQGGIQLRSARCREFKKKPELRQQVVAMLHQLGVRNLIVCGGDGSLAGAEALCREGGLKVVGVPSTIDNDLQVTEMALGVQSAVATVVWAVNHFKDTARSHQRIMVLETMGRESGELTQRAAIASGAEYAIVPEDGKMTDERVLSIAREIEHSMKRGRTHTIVLIAEGVRFEPAATENPGHEFAKKLQEYFGVPSDPDADVEVEVRPSVLGHLQRGGRPAPADAILAAEFAEVAWEAIENSAPSGIVVVREGRNQLIAFDRMTDHRSKDQWIRTAALQKALSGWGVAE
ncbi:MAG: 6-phosphofructokinase [Verrucomicrobiales bacterium]|nr:6-phosphofructokinase [Verrucomicrobiales bacterium]